MKLTISAIIALAVFATASFAVTPKPGPQPHPIIGGNLFLQLKTAPQTGHDILVYLKKQADLTTAKSTMSKLEKGRMVYNSLRLTARSSQQDLIKWLNKNKLSYRTFYITNMIAVDGVTVKQINELTQRSDVLRILGNKSFKLYPALTDNHSINEAHRGIGPNITQTGADRVWSELGVTGEGIVIAGQDTGIDWDHPGLLNKYRGKTDDGVDHNYNWHDAITRSLASKRNSCGYNLSVPCDDHGHGTHTIGTTIADDGNGNQVGMAPGAKWIGCRNMDAGDGKPSTYIDCFEYFLAPYPYGADPMQEGDPDKAAHVINNSWGCPSSEGCEGDEFIPVLEALKAAGVMVVVSAGNDGSSCSTIKAGPAHNTEYVLSVGAHDHRNGRIASFSSRGPSRWNDEPGPDVSAPGVSVRSTIKGGGHSGSYWSGTSMAGPHVAGLVALLWSADSSLIGDIDGTIEIIRTTSTGKTTSQTCGGVSGSEVPNNTYGWGHINAYDAVSSRLK